MKPTPAPDDNLTGLPGLRSWRSVYVCVLTVFALWIGLLTWLMEKFS